MIALGVGDVTEDWKARILHARQSYDLRRGTIGARTEMAQAFRRLVQAVIEPGFREVVAFAAEQGLECAAEYELGGVQPRAMFYVRPSGRSIRYILDPDGTVVREVEGVYHRALGQRLVWSSVDALHRQLTQGYARAAAAAIVQDHFRAATLPATEEDRG
jgi:hypothetical protein